MTIQFTDITGGEKEGRGTFDELMRTTKAHLDGEFDEERLVGTDYANVYLGSMQANLNASLQFSLTHELNNQQVLNAKQQVINSTKQGLLLDAQLAQLLAQTALLTDDLNTVRPQALLTAQQQTTLLVGQVEGQSRQNTLLTTQNTSEIAKTSLTGKQEDLVDDKITTEKTNVVDATGGAALAQLNKIEAEVALLGQKGTTEGAQTTGTVTTDGNGVTTSSVGGLMGVEMLLKHEQQQSFLRDAEQKAAKFFQDTISIMYSTNSAEPVRDWGLHEANSTEVFDQLLRGINVAPQAPDLWVSLVALLRHIVVARLCHY